MKKKLFCLVLAVLFVLSLFACSAPAAVEDTATDTDAVSAEKNEAQGSDVPVILVDSLEFVKDESLTIYLEYLDKEKCNIRFESLPQSSGEREMRLDKIRTEIMAGKGPDAFIMPTYGTTILHDDGRVIEPLFPNIEKTMRTGIFLPLDDLIAESKKLNLEEHNEIIMAAGCTDEGQVVLPLLYYVDVLFLNKGLMEDPDAVYETWEDFLNTADEPFRLFLSQKLTGHFGHQYSRLADYDTGELLVTKEMLAEDMWRIKQMNPHYELWPMDIEFFPYLDSIDEDHFVQYLSRTNRYSNTEGRILPLYNEDGGINALISAYTAINRNSEHVDEVFHYIELMYSEEIQSCAGIDMGKPYLFRGGIPDGYEIGASYWGLLTGKEAHTPALRDMIAPLNEQVTAARFISNLDTLLYNVWMRTTKVSEEGFADAAEQTIEKMKMILAE